MSLSTEKLGYLLKNQCTVIKQHAICPIIEENCGWVEENNNLENHLIEKHGDKIADLQRNKTFNWADIHEKYLMFRQFNYLFLLEIREACCPHEYKYCVLFIGPIELAELFSYMISLDGKEYLEMRRVEPCHQTEHRNYIRYFLKESEAFQNINIKIRMTMEEMNCFTCKETIKDGPITLLEQDKYNCSLCINNKGSNKLYCRSKEQGCQFLATEEILLAKHEKWTCKYPNNSYPKNDNKHFINKHVCQHLIENGITRLEHLLEIRHNKFSGAYDHTITNITPIEQDANILMFCSVERPEVWNYFFFRAYDLPFILGLKWTSSKWIEIMAIVGTEGHGSDDFDIMFQMSFPGVDKIISGTLDSASSSVDINTDFYDWLTIFFIENTKLAGYGLPYKMNCTITIIKKNNIDVR